MDFATNQLKELVTKYDPAVLWFAGEWEHSNEEQRAFAIGKMLLGMKPMLLINDRLFKREPGYVDFGTPENYVPATGVRNPDGTPRLWEACYTMNWNGWGYNRTKTEFHSATQLIRQLIEIVSKGGNLLLNVGPQPDGRIQADFVARLKRMGEWLKTNGEALDTLAEAKVLVEGWRREYNRFRPHSSLGYRPPAPEAYLAGKFTQGLVH